MGKVSDSLIECFSRAMAIVNIIKSVKIVKSTIYPRSMTIALSLTMLPVVSQAATYQTYVIHTYGGDALLSAVRQQLSSSPDGGTASTYQDKLVLHTTAANYKTVQRLLNQIDGQPQALTVSVRVGSNSSSQGNIQQGRVTTSNRGIQSAGTINQSNSQQQTNNLYQIRTLSGSAASISTGTLYSLNQTYTVNSYPTYPVYNRPVGQIIIQQQVLLPTTRGITVTPRLLPNGQVEVKLSQVEEQLVRAKTSSHGRYDNNTIDSQRLDSTIIVPRGQWVTIGHISQNSQAQSSDYGSNRTINSSHSVPISLSVQ